MANIMTGSVEEKSNNGFINMESVSTPRGDLHVGDSIYAALVPPSKSLRIRSDWAKVTNISRYELPNSTMYILDFEFYIDESLGVTATNIVSLESVMASSEFAIRKSIVQNKSTYSTKVSGIIDLATQMPEVEKKSVRATCETMIANIKKGGSGIGEYYIDTTRKELEKAKALGVDVSDLEIQLN